MNMTVNAALAEVAKGNTLTAWAIAQQDEGLLPSVTFDAWLEWALGVVERRAAEACIPQNESAFA